MTSTALPADRLRSLAIVGANRSTARPTYNETVCGVVVTDDAVSIYFKRTLGRGSLHGLRVVTLAPLDGLWIVASETFYGMPNIEASSRKGMHETALPADFPSTHFVNPHETRYGR